LALHPWRGPDMYVPTGHLPLPAPPSPSPLADVAAPAGTDGSSQEEAYMGRNRPRTPAGGRVQGVHVNMPKWTNGSRGTRTVQRASKMPFSTVLPNLPWQFCWLLTPAGPCPQRPFRACEGRVRGRVCPRRSQETSGLKPLLETSLFTWPPRPVGASYRDIAALRPFRAWEGNVEAQAARMASLGLFDQFRPVKASLDQFRPVKALLGQFSQSGLVWPV